MKVSKEKEQLSQMSVKELEGKFYELKKELFSLRLNSMTAHVKDYSQFKKLRKDVARVLTYLNQKRLSQRGKV